jgi:Protein of unknown function (DUF2958)
MCRPSGTVFVRSGKGTPDEIDFLPVVKLFNPCGAVTWLLTESEPDDHGTARSARAGRATASRSAEPGKFRSEPVELPRAAHRAVCWAKAAQSRATQTWPDHRGSSKTSVRGVKSRSRSFGTPVHEFTA